METANPLGVAVIMAMQKLLPVGSIIEWCPVSGGPDLSTPDKVAAHCLRIRRLCKMTIYRKYNGGRLRNSALVHSAERRCAR